MELFAADVHFEDTSFVKLGGILLGSSSLPLPGKRIIPSQNSWMGLCSIFSECIRSTFKHHGEDEAHLFFFLFKLTKYIFSVLFLVFFTFPL